MGGKGSGRKPGEGGVEKPITWFKDGDCMICTSHAKNSGGYPLIKRRGRFMALCRHILFNRYGEQPSKIESRHTCDVKACINPDHINLPSDKMAAKVSSAGSRLARQRIGPRRYAFVSDRHAETLVHDRADGPRIPLLSLAAGWERRASHFRASLFPNEDAA